MVRKLPREMFSLLTICFSRKSTTIQMNSFGKIVESTSYLAPDGRYCSNRLDALRYMVKENIFSMEDINVMQGGLKVDGWRQDPKLPKGKMVRLPSLLRC